MVKYFKTTAIRIVWGSTNGWMLLLLLIQCKTSLHRTWEKSLLHEAFRCGSDVRIMQRSHSVLHRTCFIAFNVS